MSRQNDHLQQSLLCAGAFLAWFTTRMLIATGLANFGLQGTPFALCLALLSDFLVILSLYYYSRRYVTNITFGALRPSSLLIFTGLLLALMIFNGLYAKQESWMTQISLHYRTVLPLIFLAILFLAPIGEEIMFRGFVLQGLFLWFPRQRFACALLTSLIFASMHVQYQHWQTVIALSLFSLLMCYARLFSGGLILPVTLHIIHNAIASLAWWQLNHLPGLSE
ncbi:MAG: hypothetical protein XXXJIFNMEKO3_00455 [Candidatus Erwinia impunctatus]|nr:hypothetical protein XXXJIFNMEKO_00455 [Culicoides impunctatus]